MMFKEKGHVENIKQMIGSVLVFSVCVSLVVTFVRLVNNFHSPNYPYQGARTLFSLNYEKEDAYKNVFMGLPLSLVEWMLQVDKLENAVMAKTTFVNIDMEDRNVYANAQIVSENFVNVLEARHLIENYHRGEGILLSESFYNRYFKGKRIEYEETISVSGVGFILRGIASNSFNFPNTEVDCWIIRDFNELNNEEDLPFVLSVNDGLEVFFNIKDKALINGVEGVFNNSIDKLEGDGIIEENFVRYFELQEYKNKNLGIPDAELLAVLLLYVITLLVLASIALSISMLIAVEKNLAVYATHRSLGAGRMSIAMIFLKANLPFLLISVCFSYLFCRLLNVLVINSLIEDFNLPIWLKENTLSPVLILGLAVFFLIQLVLVNTNSYIAIIKANIWDLLGRNSSRTTTTSRNWIYNTMIFVISCVTMFVVALTLLVGVDLRSRSNLDYEFLEKDYRAFAINLDMPTYIRYFRGADVYLELAQYLKEHKITKNVSLTNYNPSANDARIYEITANNGMNEKNIEVLGASISEGFFANLRFPILKGREFNRTDSQSENLKIILTDTLAEQLFDNLDPVGRNVQVRVANTEQPIQALVIGIVEDFFMSKRMRMNMTGFFMPRNHDKMPYQWFLLETSLSSENLEVFVSQKVREIDEGMAISECDRLENLIYKPLNTIRFTFQVFFVLATATVVVCALGVCYIVGEIVSSHSRVLIIKSVLGASYARIVKDYYIRYLGYIVLGIAVGGILFALLKMRMLGIFVDVTSSMWLYVMSIGMVFIVLSVSIVFPVLIALKKNETRFMEY